MTNKIRKQSGDISERGCIVNARRRVAEKRALRRMERRHAKGLPNT